MRGTKREFISRSYNLILHATLQARFSDAQCGFKAMRTECARALLPFVHDRAWFFDTELLVLAERAGLRIAEVPVDWIDDPDSRVDIRATAMADLRGIARLGRALARGDLPLRELRAQIGRQRDRGAGRLAAAWRCRRCGSASVGVLSTLAYLLLFLLTRGTLGAQLANFTALLITAIANTAVNRRFTFGVRGAGAARHQAQGLVVFGLGLLLTSGALADPVGSPRTTPVELLELSVLVAANLAATVLRFVLLRQWVFADRRRPPSDRPDPGGNK